MSNIKKMYKGIGNSPNTKIVVDIAEDDIYIELEDITIIPYELPNYLVIYSINGNSETVEVTEIIGNIITVIRGVDGTSKRPWNKGTFISRNFTNADYEKICENIEELNREKVEVNLNGDDENIVNITKNGENLEYNVISSQFYNNIVNSFTNKLELFNKEIDIVNFKENGENTEYIAISKSKYDEIMAIVNMPKEEIIKENIIHNSNFVVSELVNQRDKTTYSTKGYCFDGWNLSGDTIGNIDLTGENVVFSNNTDNVTSLNFEIENANHYAGKTLTFSLLCKVDEGDSYSLSLTDGENINACVGDFVGTGKEERVNITHTFEVGFTTCTISLNPLTNMTLFNAKVEEGNTPTKFVDDKIEDKLRKCYRYLYVVGKNYLRFNYGDGINYTVGYARFILHLPQVMRLSTPTIVNVGPKYIYFHGISGMNPTTTVSLSAAGWSDAKSGFISLEVRYPRTGTSLNTLVNITNGTTADSYLIISCEI